MSVPNETLAAAEYLPAQSTHHCSRWCKRTWIGQPAIRRAVQVGLAPEGCAQDAGRGSDNGNLNAPDSRRRDAWTRPQNLVPSRLYRRSSALQPIQNDFGHGPLLRQLVRFRRPASQVPVAQAQELPQRGRYPINRLQVIRASSRRRPPFTSTEPVKVAVSCESRRVFVALLKREKERLELLESSK
ncbi:hypothetical protein DFP72DRAFT_918000 [Ephemerocybe angulata]|uniref:Uncharacterized protein n=1 Tax=Ephemerocybe angulata TaxID=980116 RepID=A0A8H6HKJ5_9AGAR|nr:hypothetical protein DFP72DRAFT_918000 [Tulosesus angulatus]